MQYLGRTPAGDHPLKFAPNFIASASIYEFGSVFSQEGEQFFYAISRAGKREIHYTTYRNGNRPPSRILLAHAEYGFNDLIFHRMANNFILSLICQFSRMTPPRTTIF